MISTYIPTNQISKTCVKNHHQLPKTLPCVPSCHDNRTESRAAAENETSIPPLAFICLSKQAPTHPIRHTTPTSTSSLLACKSSWWKVMCVCATPDPPPTRKKGATSRARHVISSPTRSSLAQVKMVLSHPHSPPMPPFPPQTCISAVQIRLENTHPVRT